MKQDWHNYTKQLIQTEQALKNSNLSERNKTLILDFKRQLVVDGLTPARIVTYLRKLLHLGQQGAKDFDGFNKADVITLVEWVENRKLGEWSKCSYKVVIKRFFKWLRKAEDEYPPEVRWIKAAVRKDRLPLPGDGDLTTEDEALRLVSKAEQPRDKALVSSLYESGCRIGELATLQIKDCTFDKHGCRLNVIGKTGSRMVYVISAAGHLATWINLHPRRDDRNAPLWVNTGNTNHGQQMTYSAIRKLLERLFEKAGVKKRSKPHNFRHSRATHLASHLTEFQMNQHFGWKQGSTMPSVYVHLSGKNTDDALLRLHGIKQDSAENKPAFQAKPCPRCERVNPADFTYCGRCGAALDLKAAMEHEERVKETAEKRSSSDAVLNELLQDEEVRELLKRKLVAMR